MQRSIRANSIVASASFIKPRNPKQAAYISLLSKDNPTVVIASGAAGSGKTIGAVSVGLEKLKNEEVDRLILTRPTVAVGTDNIGFLPGDLHAKMDPWMRPIYDVMQQYYPRTKIDKMVKEGIIEIVPLPFMRGRSLVKSWVICDEAQNATPIQIVMMLTRIGEKSKLVITGDPMQHDLGIDVNGLDDLLSRLRYVQTPSPHIGVVEFEETDVERHPMIPYILSLYK